MRGGCRRRRWWRQWVGFAGGIEVVVGLVLMGESSAKSRRWRDPIPEPALDAGPIPDPLGDDAPDPPAASSPCVFGFVWPWFEIASWLWFAPGEKAAEDEDDPSGNVNANKLPTNASVWCNRDSIAPMYLFGGPHLRNGPRNVHSMSARVSVHFRV